jgi:hypothetical protein
VRVCVALYMSAPHIDPPLKRPLQIFAFDPMRGLDARNVITIDVENEPLSPGPQGARVRVVDYDGKEQRYLHPVDLDDPAILMTEGLPPSESDPRFHQQMVYAVTMKVLENFDRALGRRIDFRGKPLLLVPHAFHGTNAYYIPALKGIVFGYFPADSEDPGENVPGQPVFTCLSHDIIAHEVTHALVHRLRQHSLEATNQDVLAFHEGFADIVAIFQHFTFASILRDAIRESRGDLSAHTALAELAAQFGYATGGNGALRSAIDAPDPTGYRTVLEPHARGSILVGAVFEGFFRLYQSRIADLVRLATGGSGVLPPGELPHDLVERLADEAARAAQTVLTMCIRAFEYLPPLDITFGDFLRAMITADRDLLAEEGTEQRRMMIDAFRRRGIYPSGVTSLSEGALCWPPSTVGLNLGDSVGQRIAEVLLRGAEEYGQRRIFQRATAANAAPALQQWAKANAAVLGLSTDVPIEAQGFHATYRVAPSGRLAVEIVAQFVQQQPETEDDPSYGGLRFRGGTTVVATADGVVRFVIAKPLASVDRRNAQLEFVAACDADDPALSFAGDDYFKDRIARLNFRGLHEGNAG